jgi:hypothetical protein
MQFLSHRISPPDRPIDNWIVAKSMRSRSRLEELPAQEEIAASETGSEAEERNKS